MSTKSSLITSAAFLCVLFTTFVNAAAVKNVTITVPDGVFDDGDPNLLCKPTHWTDIVIFYLGNYAAHAVTVITEPGESTLSAALAITSALFLPFSGVMRGINAILSMAKFAKTDLETAARAGALCMVVRDRHWRPHAGDIVSNAIIESGTDATRETEGISYTQAAIEIFHSPWSLKVKVRHTNPVHGSVRLPSGYKLALVPKDATFVNTSKMPPRDSNPISRSYGALKRIFSQMREIQKNERQYLEFSSKFRSDQTLVSSSYSAIKALVALGQSVYTITTLYQSRGDQITRYGYAAFGLTVAPYAVMSIINLLANLMVPQYPAMYLVESSVMIEAQKREGCYFDGVVGKLREDGAAIFESEVQNQYWLTEPVTFKGIDGDNELKFRLQLPVLEPPELRLVGKTPVNENDVDTGAPRDSKEFIVMPSRMEENLVSTQDQASTAPTPSIHRTSATNPNETNSIPSSHSTLFIPSCPLLSSGREVNQDDPRRNLRYTISESRNRIALYPDSQDEENPWSGALAYSIIGIPIAIIGGLTRFRARSSTRAQRVWTMAWLAFGSFFGIGVPSAAKESLALAVFVQIFFSTPAIGGFVVVGQMLLEFGSCISIK